MRAGFGRVSVASADRNAPLAGEMLARRLKAAMSPQVGGLHAHANGALNTCAQQVLRWCAGDRRNTFGLPLVLFDWRALCPLKAQDELRPLGVVTVFLLPLPSPPPATDLMDLKRISNGSYHALSTRKSSYY